MKTETLTVELGERRYPIHFSDSFRALVDKISELRAAGRSLRVIADSGLLAAQSNYLKAAGVQVDEILSLPAGEQTKSSEHFANCLSFLAQGALNRDSAVFAFGGGVIGDLTGFVAASYLRGIDFYQIPTTLLSMVDSSVGGKTGINLPEGKNLVGAFWQPKAVYIDTEVLQTLPDREFAAGMAEVIKYGLLADLQLFEDLENFGAVSTGSEQLGEIIRRCCAIKAEVVANDEKETASSGGRALLNLGHTFAHAIENVAGYGQYLHGEAVAIGLSLATRLSVELKALPTESIARVDSLLEAYQLPTQLKQPLPINSLMAAMSLDKKNRSGRLRFVSMIALGAAITTEDVPLVLVEQLWKTVGAN